MKPSPSRSIIEPQLSLRHPLPKKQQMDAGEWSAVETGRWQSPGLQSLHRPRDKGKNPPAITLALICGNVTVDCEASALMFAMPNLPSDVAQLFRAALRRGNSAGDAAPH
jgi:hypothetical protein